MVAVRTADEARLRVGKEAVTGIRSLAQAGGQPKLRWDQSRQAVGIEVEPSKCSELAELRRQQARDGVLIEQQVAIETGAVEPADLGR
jgi:hypothetical protein